LIGFLLAVALLAPAGDGGETLRARFLGNEAFEITDGVTTLLTDFPYRSGAFGYMAYATSEIRRRPRSVCLFTHAHADHFEPALLARVGCRIAGPPPVLAAAPPGSVITPDRDGALRIFGLAIDPVATPHGETPHASYRVEWLGLRLYFTGDTDSTRELAAQKILDALFLSPWLLAAARSSGALPAARRVIVYHQRSGETIGPCGGCVVPRQGETIEIR
jgi:L-ascorbate metabolism protein UlaG (beta-lactamase superfamily)